MAFLAVFSDFLGTRASLMLDVVFLAMLLVLPALAVSIWLARHGHFAAHKWLQLFLGGALFLIVLAFEIDVRFFTNWRALAEPSPYYHATGWLTVKTALAVHLVFAIPVIFVWAYVIFQALRKFSRPPRPGRHSKVHRPWGWVATVMMVMTAVTGCVFYYLAFVAT